MIFHITNKNAWTKAVEIGSYFPEGFEKEGFIHCSKRDQILEVAVRYYDGCKDLVLLEIDESKVDVKIIYENLIGGFDLFPHIYGPLDVKAVVAARDFVQNGEGKFIFPAK